MISEIFKKILDNPVYYFTVANALFRGSWYIVFYRLFRKNVKIAFPFKAFARVIIIGPGSVVIGKNCSVLKNVFKGLTIVTLSEKAKVKIGSQGNLGGLTIRCRNQVTIGNRVMTAASVIQDDFIINTDQAVGRGHNHQFRSSGDIEIKNNVWLGGNSTVLAGSMVGNDCVLSVGSCCYDVEIKDYSLVSGNPAKRPLAIDRLLKLKGVA